MYADYRYYKEEYLGSRIEETDFPRLALRAAAYLDQVTFQRLADLEPVPEAAKKALCAIAELEQRLEEGERGKASEQVGNYRVSWEAGHGAELAAERYEAARRYLGATGLLYRGV